MVLVVLMWMFHLDNSYLILFFLVALEETSLVTIY